MLAIPDFEYRKALGFLGLNIIQTVIDMLRFSL